MAAERRMLTATKNQGDVSIGEGYARELISPASPQGFPILLSVWSDSRGFATLAGEEVLARVAARPAPAPLPLRANRKRFARNERMGKPWLTFQDSPILH